MKSTSARFNRAAIMRDAHKRWRDSKRLQLGWDFSRCLRQAWIAAKLRSEFPRQRYNPDSAERISRISAIGIEIHRETLQALAR
jgi:hypothetical protein